MVLYPAVSLVSINPAGSHDHTGGRSHSVRDGSAMPPRDPDEDEEDEEEEEEDDADEPPVVREPDED
jgi:hypothetical protein